MKRLIPYILSILFIHISVATFSQGNSVKPKLFNSFPQKISCSQLELNKAFAASEKQSVELLFSDNFLFGGTVLSNTVKYNTMQTVVIKSAAFNNALFVVTKITTVGKEPEYRGRIINTTYFDGYELKKDELNNYQLIKFETDKLLQDCKPI
jgi:hypothetical protein